LGILFIKIQFYQLFQKLIFLEKKTKKFSMEKIMKEYLPKIQPMKIENGSKNFRRCWEEKIDVGDVNALVLLRLVFEKIF